MISVKDVTNSYVWKKYQKGVSFNLQQNLNDTVRTNENFFIGKQWEGVEANGLPTPVFNFLKRVVLFTVAGITSDNLKMQASILGNIASTKSISQVLDVVNREFEFLFEYNSIVNKLREFMRNAAVDGDGCTYTYWDPDVDTGHPVKGAIKTEIIENTRVFFGNPNDRNPQRQPYIIIQSREAIDDLKDRAKDNGVTDPESIIADSDDKNSNPENYTDDNATVLLMLWRDKKSGTIWAAECTKDVIIRKPWDLGISLYPITWLNWDYVNDNYHGQAMISGLIPNQIFINKLFAMSMISLMTTAYPKIVYDKNRIPKWDNRVGAAIPVQGGDVSNVAKIIDPAQISPQIAQFIELAINYTQTFLGATSVALGDTRPDNTSAIIALQRAASTPNEITKQNLYESLEDLGRIYIEFMAENYGKRTVEMSVAKLPQEMAQIIEFSGLAPTEKVPVEFDFAQLKETKLNTMLDVGASAYWSEIASMQTMDNLLMQNKISLVDYLERIPNGYITKKQELIDKYTQPAQPQPAMPGAGPMAPGMEGNGAGMPGQVAASGSPAPVPTGAGYHNLQRKINETGQVPA